MQLRVQLFTVHKRFALTISRGTTAQTTNVWVVIEHDGIEGWGEASPFSIGEQPQTTEMIARSLQKIAPLLKALSPLERQRIERLMLEARLPSGARAALDIALHDWAGKQANLPLWQLWGLERDRIVPTSITIGINPPDLAQQRVKDWLGQVPTLQALKLKLGSPNWVGGRPGNGVSRPKRCAPHYPNERRCKWRLEARASVANVLLVSRSRHYLH
jgi:L-alanine-DL-glutamate epimerase-like enolase superfamily enzyme